MRSTQRELAASREDAGLELPAFVEAQLEWLDDERLQLTFRSPTRAGQSRVVLGRRPRS